MSDVRAYACFAIEHDRDLRDALSEQARRGGSGFQVSGESKAGKPTTAWTSATRRRIREADLVIVICGEHTNACPRVDTELALAQDESKPTLMLWGRRERMCQMPPGAPRHESMYSWAVLPQQITETLRNAQPLVVSEREKRP